MALFTDDISINSILGPGSSIKGDIKINGFTRIDGDLEGNLETTGNVIVGEKARIRGNITAKSITVIGGIIQGNISAPESIELLSSSVVIGNIVTKKFKAEEDVFLHGHVIALSDEEAYTDAQDRWQDAQAIAAKALMNNLHLSIAAKLAKATAESQNVTSESAENETTSKPRGLFSNSRKR